MVHWKTLNCKLISSPERSNTCWWSLLIVWTLSEKSRKSRNGTDRRVFLRLFGQITTHTPEKSRRTHRFVPPRPNIHLSVARCSPNKKSDIMCSAGHFFHFMGSVQQKMRTHRMLFSWMFPLYHSVFFDTTLVVNKPKRNPFGGIWHSRNPRHMFLFWHLNGFKRHPVDRVAMSMFPGGLPEHVMGPVPGQSSHGREKTSPTHSDTSDRHAPFDVPTSMTPTPTQTTMMSPHGCPARKGRGGREGRTARVWVPGVRIRRFLG